MSDKDPFDRPMSNVGVGMLNDGKLNVVTPEQMKERAAERDAEDEEGSDDIGDLDDYDELFEIPPKAT